MENEACGFSDFDRGAMRQKMAIFKKGIFFKKETISPVSQRVTEKDRRIWPVSQHVTEKDRRICPLSQLVTEKARQISSVTQLVTENVVIHLKMIFHFRN